MNLDKYLSGINWFVQSFGHVEKESVVAPQTVVMYNDMYPYTFEQTIRVTHHSKPKRRDPARKWNKNKNYRF